MKGPRDKKARRGAPKRQGKDCLQPVGNPRCGPDSSSGVSLEDRDIGTQRVWRWTFLSTWRVRKALGRT